MANEIDLIIGDAAFKQISDLLLKLGEVDTKFGEIATKFSNLGKGANPQSTAELAKLTAENEKLNKVLTELRASYASIDSGLAKANTTRATSSKLITQETIDIRLQNKELAQTYTELSKKADAYQVADAQFRQMAKSLKAMAFEGKEGTKAFIDKEKALAALGNRLKAVDAMTGSHTRNVGNYSSSWNGLGNSINQLTREAPAFANSVQTGFMALSNNIPILTDELGVLIQKNKDLQKDGKPTESILKTVAGAFFSWQTAISLGVTILTVYGAKIWDLVSGLDALKRKQEAFEISQKLMDDQIEQTTKNILHQGKMRKDAAVLAGKSADEIRAIDLQTQKDVQANLVIVNESNKKKYENSKKYADAKIRIDELTSASSTLSSKTEIQRAKEQQEYYKNLAIVNKYRNWKESEEGLALKKEAYDKSNKALVAQGFIVSELQSGQKVEEFNENKKNQKNIDKENAKNDKTAEENAKNAFERKISDLEKQKDIDSDALDSFSGVLQERQILSGKVAADEVKIVEAKYEEELRLADGNADLIAAAENHKFIAIGNIRDENIKRVQDMYKEEEDIQAESLKNQLDEQKRQSALLKELEDIVDKDQKDRDKKKADYLKSFADEFASKSGLTETFKMMSGEIEGFGTDTAVTFNAVAESAQEMFNKMAEYSMANYEQEYARLEAQKETSLKFAGDSTAAKEKIEKDYAAKKKEIDKRQFEDEKKISMVNIVIDTAQAIMSTYKKTGFFGTPLAIIMGAFGAAQLAMVAAQQFPAYAEGTDNHKGGLMLVNDGAGSNFQEKVILPSGKVIRPQGRNVLMDAPKGTKVLNHEQQLFEMLQSNNISMSSQQASGLTYDEMNEIFQKNLSNIKTQNTIFDKNGFQSYVKNGNSITRSNSNRSQAIGISV
jgi:hypothetical protein